VVCGRVRKRVWELHRVHFRDLYGRRAVVGGDGLGDGEPRGRGSGDDDLYEWSDGRDGSWDVHVCMDRTAGGMQQHGGVVQLHADVALGQSLHGDPDGNGRERGHGKRVVHPDGGPRIVGGDYLGDGEPGGCGASDDDLDERSDGWLGTWNLHVCVGRATGGVQQHGGVVQLHAE
jgi:hypothetical protein